MGKFDIDTLLDELGERRGPTPPGAGASAQSPGAGAPTEPSASIPAPASAEVPDASDSAADTDPADTIKPAETIALSDTLSRTMSGTLSGTMSGTMSPGSSRSAKAPMETDAWDHLGIIKRLLVEGGIASLKQISASETIIRQSPGASLLELLLDQGVDELRLFEIVATALRLTLRRLAIAAEGPRPFDERLLHRLGTEFCKQHHALPLGVEGDRVVLGVARPDDVFVPDEVRLKLAARSLKLVVITPSDLRACLDSLGDAEADGVNIDEILSDIEEDDVQVEQRETVEVDLEREAADAPVVRYVNYIIQTAVKEGASDIHIEPGEKALKVRFRIDGELFEMMQPPGKMAAAITSRLKIMANLDIAERRLPQDGRIRCSVQGRKLDLRMSTLPTAVGEKTVLRILDTRSINVSLDDLGFDENTLTIWKNLVEMPHGIVLVTGPTGSGKTTTLYASLRQMDKKTQNVSTVEDPIEYHLDGITQTQTHEKIGMTFAKALKALLRQDPDVIMLGEIRDQETALTAVQAALTGHLVLSTLHTNDAPSSITRLVNIGIEPFLLGAAVNGCLAQRLVRRICQHCRQPANLTNEMTEFLELQGMVASSLFEGSGCERCRNTGHQGRLGIYELLALDDNIRDVIARNPNVTEFRRMCVERGMVTLRQDGLSKVSKGLTTVHEVLRATEANA